MKDWLILLCIGAGALLLFHESSRWMSPKTGPAAASPETPAALPRKGEFRQFDPPIGTPPDKNTLAALVIQSQRAAVAKYPALGLPDSEINIRFTYRYKNLVADRSPRLQDPAWPVQLADECARDAGVHSTAKVSTPPPSVPSRKSAALPSSQGTAKM